MRGRRPTARTTIEGRTWVLVDAGRAPSGLGLGYFVAEGGDSDDSDDRRVALDPEVDVSELAASDVEALWAAGVPLTVTERRVTTPDGELWLAQAVGPVWAEGGVAADVVGVRLRCLTADAPPVQVGGRMLGDLSDEDLHSLTRRDEES